MSIQGFLSDRSLIDSSRPFVNLEKMNIPCGYLDRDTVEYFVEPLEVSDLRPERLTISYRNEGNIIATDPAVLEDTILTVLQKGISHLNLFPKETVTLAEYPDLDFLEFINDVMPVGPVAISSSRELRLTIDATKFSDEDQAAFENITAEEQLRLFNILEYLAYGTISTDTLSDINVVLSSESQYTGYVSNTVVTTGRTVVFIYGGLNIHRFVPDSIAFTFIIGSSKVEIKVWINREAFKAQYPNCTIINVVPPMELSVLLDPSSLTDPVTSAIQSKAWSDAIITPEVGGRDQTGMFLFDTRYLYHGKTYNITFSLIYRGRQPDTMEARNFVADYLLSSGIGTKALWETLIPDVFYHSLFALIPFYDNVTELTNADIYPSIIDASSLLNKVQSVLNKIPRATDPHREFMTAAYDRFLVGVAPADVNESSSLLALHPTYRDFSTTDVGFSEMTAEDREWAVRVNQAFSMASGETNILTMSLITTGTLEWINFVYNQVSYLVLTRTSYYKHFGLE